MEFGRNRCLSVDKTVFLQDYFLPRFPWLQHNLYLFLFQDIAFGRFYFL